MKSVLVLDASMRAGYTKALTEDVIKKLTGKYNIELVNIKDEQFETCKGCCACLFAGSSHCPLKGDGVQGVLQKMLDADGIIFLVPNYSLQIPGKLKTMLDRMAFVFHRPRLFNKVFMPVTVQGVYGGGDINKYLNKVLRFWGARTVKGAVLSGGVYPKQINAKLFTKKNMNNLTKSLKAFDREMEAVKPKKPSLFQVVLYRSTRSAMLHFDETLKPDKEYYLKNGWDKADYYYDVHLGLFKKSVGFVIDKQMKAMAKKANAAQRTANP
jgi:multimeric flavodoxin WrbA